MIKKSYKRDIENIAIYEPFSFTENVKRDASFLKVAT